MARNWRQNRLINSLLAAVFAIFCLAGHVLSQTTTSEEAKEIRKLGQCGLVTRYASTQIPDECLQEATNVYLDEDLGIVRRKGFADFNATAIGDSRSVRGIWPFRATDGTEYMVVLSSETMYQSSGGDFAAISPAITYLSSTQDMDCTQCLGRLWCVNGTQTQFFWDGTSTGTASGAPTCQQIECHRNRLALGNCSGTLSQLRLSGELDGTDYTIPTSPVSTSPAVISVGGVNDGNNLLCIQGVYQDVLVMGKRDSTWGLYGFDRRDFAVRQLSQEVGCVEPRSAREKQGSLYWLSKRGVEKMTGPSIERISDPVRDLIDTIITAGGNSRSAQDTSQTDFEAGNLTASGAGASVSAVINPSNVVVSSWTGIDTSSTNFADGTMTDVSTRTIGDLELGNSLSNVGFEVDTGSCTTGVDNISNWTCSLSVSTGVFDTDSVADVSGRCPSLALYGDAGVTTSCMSGTTGVSSLTVAVLNGDTDAIVYSRNHSGAGDNCTNFSFDTSTQTINNFKIRITNTSGDTLTSSSFSRTRHILYAFSADACIPSTFHQQTVDFPEPFYTRSGTFTSRAFETSFSTPTWGLFEATVSSASNRAITFQTQVATSSSGEWTAAVAATLGTEIGSDQRRYIRYAALFETDSSSTTPSIHDVSLAARTTAYFISQARNPGTAITQWGLFQCNRILNGGDFTFYISTGTSANQVTRTTATWTTQTNNTVITVATASFVAYRALFDIDVGTENPTLNDCTINWNEGTTRPSVTAEVYRDRYYLAYTTGTSGTVANTNIVIADSRDQWVLHDAPNCYSLGIYNRRFYCGDSGNTGQVSQIDVGQDDDGASFTSRIKTKDFDFGNPWQPKILSRIYYDLAGLPDSGYNIDLTPSYFLETSTDVVTLGTIGLDEDYGRFIAAKVPASLSNNTTARWFSFALEHSGTQGPWKLFGLKLVFKRLRED